MQTQNRFLDDITRLFSNAIGTAQGVREEIETLMRQQFERLLAEFDLVRRDEFEAMQSMATTARSEVETLRHRIDDLERKFRVIETRGLASSAGPAGEPSSGALYGD